LHFVADMGDDMETLEYYKLKDELTGLIRDEISKSLGNERDLQQRYISVGLKVAAAGVAAAVLTLGLFGIKSFYEVDSAIKKIPDIINKRANDEVTARFNNNNPVAQYENALLESAARATASSLAAQAARGNFSLEARATDLIVRALNSKTTTLQTKLSLVSSLSSPKVGSVSPSIDQAVITTEQDIANQNPLDESKLRTFIDYFSVRIPERFVGEVEKIYDAHDGSPEIRMAVGRYAMSLEKDTGNLVKKLEKSDDASLKYFLHIRELKNGKVKQVDREIFNAVFSRAINNRSDDEIGLSDVIEHIDAVDDDAPAEVVSQLIDAIREYAISKNLSLAVDDDSDNASFHFYASDLSKASSGLDRRDFDTLARLATEGIIDSLKQSKGEFTDRIKQAMDFWSPRSAPDAQADDRQAGAFILSDARKMRFVAQDGSEIAGNVISSRALVTTQRNGAEINVLLKWDDELGQTKSMPIKVILDFDPDKLRRQGIWRRPTNDSWAD
jgi:hypothetical protein